MAARKALCESAIQAMGVESLWDRGLNMLCEGSAAGRLTGAKVHVNE